MVTLELTACCLVFNFSIKLSEMIGVPVLFYFSGIKLLVEYDLVVSILLYQYSEINSTISCKICRGV